LRESASTFGIGYCAPKPTGSPWAGGRDAGPGAAFAGPACAAAATGGGALATAGLPISGAFVAGSTRIGVSGGGTFGGVAFSAGAEFDCASTGVSGAALAAGVALSPVEAMVASADALGDSVESGGAVSGCAGTDLLRDGLAGAVLADTRFAVAPTGGSAVCVAGEGFAAGASDSGGSGRAAGVFTQSSSDSALGALAEVLRGFAAGFFRALTHFGWDGALPEDAAELDGALAAVLAAPDAFGDGAPFDFAGPAPGP